MSGSSAQDGSELMVTLSDSATNPQSTLDLTSTLKKVSIDASTTVTVDLLNNNNNNNSVDDDIIDKATDNSIMGTAHVDANNESSLRCTCGCVPNVMSLFEMAALRAEYRKRMKASEHK